MATVRGVAHVHSTHSFDGRLDIKDLAAFFQEHGMHFVLMSEHIERLDPEKIRALISDCETYSSRNFLLIPGIEIDALNALFFSVQPVDSWTDTEDLAQQLAAGGALVAVSHPVKVKKTIPAVTASVIEGVEVWNSRYDGKLAIDTRIVRFWLDLRKSLGRPLVPLCGIDFHSRHDFVSLVFELSCDRLDRDEIMTAIRAGRHRIVRSRKPVPLDFTTGELAPLYWMSSSLYHSITRMIYRVHRGLQRIGLKAPSRLRYLLRRVF
jgi:hypothetical protein